MRLDIQNHLESAPTRNEQTAVLPTTGSIRTHLRNRFAASAIEIWLGFGLAVATLLMVGAVSYWSTREFQETTGWVTHTYRVIDTLRDLQAASTRAENENWGSILAGTPSNLVDRKGNADRFDKDLAQLRLLVSDNPLEEQNLAAVESLMRARITLSEDALAKARRDGQTAGVDYALTRGWLPLGEEIERHVRTMTATENTLLDQRQAREQVTARFSIRIIVYGSLAAMLFIGFAAVFIHRVLGRLRAATEMAELAAHQAEQRGQELAHQIATVQRAQERLGNLLESSTDAILTVDLNGQITYANGRATQYFGYPVAELVGSNVDRLVPGSKREEHAANRAAYAREPRVRAMAPNLELSAVRRDGTAFPVEISLSPVEADDGPQVLTTIRDMTEYRRAQEYRAILSAIVEASRYSIISHTPEGVVLSWNPGAEQLYGWTAAEIVGRNIAVLIPEDRPTELRDTTARLADGHTTLEYETRRKRKNASLVDIAISKAPIVDYRGRLTAISAISYDITERKSAEADLRARTEELARSNAELEQFAYVASHDLQEPLRMVASYLQLIAQRYSGRLDADADDFINFAVDGATRMKQLINDLLNYSRAGRGPDPAVLDLNAPLSRALASLSLSIEETSAEITNDPLPRVMGDENRLYEVFQNLIGNAIKFRGAAPAQIHIGARREDGEWTISVADHGLGIAPEYQQRIFAMFQRLHGREEYPGTGIGLAICKRIIERLGGRIWVDSQAGQGATFCFTLSACEVENESDHDCEARVGGDSAG